MSRPCRSFTFLALVVGAACARHRQATPAPTPPAFILGVFSDDYGVQYEITPTEWVQLPRARYRIVRWDAAGQFAIAQNDLGNPSDGGLWTRIDWVELPGMAPFTWGFCYSTYRAPSAAAAESVIVANRATPRTGCNGFPFSRMRRQSSGSGAPRRPGELARVSTCRRPASYITLKQAAC